MLLFVVLLVVVSVFNNDVFYMFFYSFYICLFYICLFRRVFSFFYDRLVFRPFWIGLLPPGIYTYNIILKFFILYEKHKNCTLCK